MLQSSAFRTALATWLSEQCHGELDGGETQSDDDARGSRGPHAEDDGSTVIVAAAAAAKARAVGPPVFDPKPAARPAVTEAANPTAKPDATRDAPVPLVDGAQCMADGRPPDRNGRRKALADKGQGSGTKAPARKKQGGRPASRPMREGQWEGHRTATPRRQADSDGWIEPPPVRTNLSRKPKTPLPGRKGLVTTPARALANGRKAPLAGMLTHM
ncbi:hypothetical protein PCL_12114 [Purpureocillium lilacinum]|uniref:Uncharacterized protein n=1 Tax=Purpureocillium lilacinum TaxID=33203 RepID=A0A2U3DPF2_PURLI|nr:hypothetical protein PCL_12114 [Purpureocillium lilacinum]